MTPQARAAPLIYPARLSPDEREAAARTLAEIPAAHHQAVLDELEGRLQAVTKGGPPVYNELGYLRYYCQQVKAARFESVLGIKVRGERQRRRREAQARREEARAREAARRRQRAQRAAGEDPLAVVKRQLGHPSKTKN